MTPASGQRGTVGPNSVVSAGAVGNEALTDEQQRLLLDVGQMLLDVAGIFEPTPFCDTTNAVISATRSDWSGAAISVAGTIPYIGDAAKAGRFPKYLKSVERAIAEARQSRPLANLLRPVLTKLYCALDLLPAADLPAAMTKTIKELRRRLVDFLGPAGRAARARSLLKALRGQVDDAGKVLDTIESQLKHAAGSAEPAADDFLAELTQHVKNFEGKPKLRVTTKPERAARASDTIGSPKGADGQVIGKAGDTGKYLVPTDDLNESRRPQRVGRRAPFQRHDGARAAGDSGRLHLARRYRKRARQAGRRRAAGGPPRSARPRRASCRCRASAPFSTAAPKSAAGSSTMAAGTNRAPAFTASRLARSI